MTTVSQPNTRRLWAPLLLAAAVGALALVQPANATAKTLNVNPISGADTNPATATAPLKTLTKALSTAVAGDTVKLAGGGYGQGLGGTGNGEQIPATGLKVPSGVTIDGATENGFPIATLLGQGSGVGLNLAGNATSATCSSAAAPASASASTPRTARRPSATCSSPPGPRLAPRSTASRSTAATAS